MVTIFVCLGFSVGFVMLVALFTLPTVMAPLVTECPYWAVKVIFNLDLWQLGHYCVVTCCIKVGSLVLLVFYLRHALFSKGLSLNNN